VRLADPAEDVAHPVHPASLLAGAQHFRGGRAQALVIIGDDELHAPQAAGRQRPQEVLPERFSFGFTRGKAQNLPPAFGIRSDSHYCGGGNNPSAVAVLDVGCIDPKIGPLTFDGRFRKACTRSSISSQSRLTWLLDMPVRPSPVPGHRQRVLICP
jgi:hypothetical protein